MSCFLQSTKPSLAIRWFLILLQVKTHAPSRAVIHIMWGRGSLLPPFFSLSSHFLALSPSQYQALSIPPYFLACVIYSPLCHATARFVANLAVCLYTTAIERYEHHELVLIRRLPIPPVARHFYGLQVRPGEKERMQIQQIVGG
jgi:hypothetical protein